MQMSDERTAKAPTMWMATVRPNGTPHLVPIWFVVVDEKWYFATDPNSVKARNLQHNSAIAISLEDGTNPFVVEGNAKIVKPTAKVVEQFKKKYDWDMSGDNDYVVFEVVVKRKVLGG